jgi:hypothetical protein
LHLLTDSQQNTKRKGIERISEKELHLCAFNELAITYSEEKKSESGKYLYGSM